MKKLKNTRNKSSIFKGFWNTKLQYVLELSKFKIIYIMHACFDCTRIERRMRNSFAKKPYKLKVK